MTRPYGLGLTRPTFRYRVRRPVSYHNVHFKKNNVVKTIPTLDKENSFTFTFKPTKFTPGWSSIVHLSTGANLSRLPGLFIYNNILYVTGYVSGNRNYQVNKKIQVNKWTTVRVVNSKVGSIYYWSVYVNGKLIRKVRNTRPKTFKNVKVYITDPWYKPFVGTMKTVSIQSSTRRVRYRGKKRYFLREKIYFL